ncbi:ABC transporter permease [Pontibacter sp. G13]|uniref:ABC transporter permease n=1 Tax=Pontibacter sp. G13 TaxID=3074898 RepID=UPI00288A6746|nr:ABC transporter permease [Pontibacter sp. G13]WNJ16979.1 ABC transporter permease [Pontibacter sp. G13]
MIQHYFHTAFRNLLRNRVSSVINLVGLALGMACCLIITLFVQDEFGYDKFQEKGDRIYRVSNIMELAGTGDHYALTGLAVGPRMAEAFPEIEQFARVMARPEPSNIQFDQQSFNEDHVHHVDPHVFEVFSWPLAVGDPENVLDGPGKVVLSQALATKYFQSESPIGKRMLVDGRDFEVTGVMEDLPSNTHLPVDALISIDNIPVAAQERLGADWGRLMTYTYFLFRENQDLTDFQAKLDQFALDHVIPFWQENGVKGDMIYQIINLDDLHFRQGISYDMPKGNKEYVYMFSLVAVFILLIACFNYVNLSVAQATKRSKEVGIRKAAGAVKSNIVTQFLGESLLMAACALVLSWVLAELALPFFNQLADKSFGFFDLFRPTLMQAMVGLVVFVAIAAGSYPALVLGRMSPVSVLKGQYKLTGNSLLRKSLVVLQFGISIGLMISTWVIFEQMKFMEKQDLGFQDEQVMVIEVPRDTAIQRRITQVQHELLEHPGVEALAGASSRVPGEGTGELLFRIEDDGQLVEETIKVVGVDERFMETMEIPLLEGRNFDRSRATDPHQAFIVNEALVRKMGWEQPLGKRIQWGLMANNQAQNDGQVVGVIADYHFNSLHQEVDPLVWIFSSRGIGRLLVKMNGHQLKETLTFVEDKWTTFDSSHPMESFFLDSFFLQQYETERRLMDLFMGFSLLTILIACLGLYGLASFVTKRRVKEIGIRKVMGAQESQIVWLISKEFSMLVLVAFALAIPVVWWLMRDWLAGFAFHTEMPYLGYAGVGMMALALAFFTTGLHSLKAARANPIESLRYE